MVSKHFLAAAALVALASTASADTVGIHLASRHWPSADWNNANPGLYYRRADGWTGGFYRNSERRWTVYGGYTFEGDLADWKPALTVGAMYGYRHGDCRDNKPQAWLDEDAPEKCRTRLQLLLLPSLGTPAVRDWRLRLAYMPKVEKRGSHVVHVAVERSFDFD